MTADFLTFATVRAELHDLGLVIDADPGEYRVNYRHGTAASIYLTDDLLDALAAGRRMAESVPPTPPPPLGPCRGRQRRRGLMYRHNAAIARERAKAQAMKDAE